MKKNIFLLLLLISTVSVPGQNNMKMDGDESDWVNDPVLIEAPDNVEGYFPAEVGAAVTDIVDVKEVKAKFVGNRIYFFIRFWGGPVWPNYARIKNDPNYGTIYRHRGYYQLILDLDNNRETGWDTRYYETHLTPLGYRRSQGLENTDFIGAEMFYWVGLYVNWSAPHPDNGRVRYIRYHSENTLPVDATDLNMTIFEYNVSNPDSIATMHFDGYLASDSSMAWFGHAWGYDFIECGFSLSEMRQYWQKKGFDFLQPGQTIGISAMVETPIDHWGIDLSPRGEIKIPGNVKVAKNVSASIPHKLFLYVNYPNPFNMETTIRYSLPQTAHVRIEIYNTLGQKIRTLANARFSAGMHTLRWDGLDDLGNTLATGIYLCVLRYQTTRIAKRMLLLK